MKTTELIKLLDKEGNKYGASGKERELYLSINGDFVGDIKTAKLDGWGDGLVTDVTMEVQVDNMEYHDKKIRNQAIDDFVEALKQEYAPLKEEMQAQYLSVCKRFEEVGEQLKN